MENIIPLGIFVYNFWRGALPSQHAHTTASAISGSYVHHSKGEHSPEHVTKSTNPQYYHNARGSTRAKYLEAKSEHSFSLIICINGDITFCQGTGTTLDKSKL